MTTHRDSSTIIFRIFAGTEQTK